MIECHGTNSIVPLDCYTEIEGTSEEGKAHWKLRLKNGIHYLNPEN